MTHTDNIGTRKNSFIHKRHVAVKLIVTLSYIVCIMSVSPYRFEHLLVLCAYPLFVTIVSEISILTLLKKIVLILPFPVVCGAANIFWNKETVFILWIFGRQIPVTAGILLFLSIVAKAVLTVWVILLLIECAQFEEIIGALRRWHVPQSLCTQLSMTYRYISLISREALAMKTAYVLRHESGKSVFPYTKIARRKKSAIHIKDMGSFLGLLILRGFDRAGEVEQAMKCRGFDRNYTGTQTAEITRLDYAYMFLWILFFVCSKLVKGLNIQ